MHHTYFHQYHLVRSSRSALLNYLAGVSPQDLTKPVSSHNNDSMHTLLMHTINTYVWWLVNFSMQQQRTFFAKNEHTSLTSVRALYEQVDLMVNDFLHHFKDSFEIPLTVLVEEGREQTATPLELFTHTITHEFHHKGQIVNISRQLGYTPVDTDVIRD